MKEYFIGISGTPLKLMESFVCGRYQHVLLNGQASFWLPILAGVPQGSILGPLFFLIYLNDLSQNLSWTTKLFADDTSVFSIVHDIDSSTKQLNDDLKMVLDWAYQWKMYFNPDFSKQAPKLIFSSKSSRVDHRSIIRPHLDYGDVIYGQPNNQDFINKLKVVQYNAALAITGAIRGRSKTKFIRN